MKAANEPRGRARIGCSGWLSASRWFEHYASIFDTVEINNSFYRLPERQMFATWAARAPRQFAFAVKASGF